MANIREVANGDMSNRFFPILRPGESHRRLPNLTPVFTQIDGNPRPAYSYRAIVEESFDGELEIVSPSPLNLGDMFEIFPQAQVFIQLEVSEQPGPGKLGESRALYNFEVVEGDEGISLINGVEYGQTAQMEDPIRVVRNEGEAPFVKELHLDDPVVMSGHPIQLKRPIIFIGPFDSEIIIGGVRTTPNNSLVATVSEVLIVPNEGLADPDQFLDFLGETEISSLPEMVYGRQQMQAA